MKKEYKTKGIASLFDQIEIKSFLKNYLIFIGIVEAVIFFVCFVEQLGSQNIPFPWKNYFFAAFIIPVVITFLLGILVAGFNKYLYGSSPYDTSTEIAKKDPQEKDGYMQKIDTFLQLIQKLPFLLTLFILTITAGIIYKLDSIIGFISTAGQKSMEYLIISIGALLGVATLFTIIWLILNYKLQKKAIQYKHSYRESVIKQLGMVILDNDTVLDKNGNIVSKGENGNKTNKFKPSLPKKINTSLKDTNLIEIEKKEDQ